MIADFIRSFFFDHSPGRIKTPFKSIHKTYKHLRMKTLTIAAGKYLLRSCLAWSLLLVFAATSVSAQQKTVTGTVKSEDGSPLVAASIQVKGTTIGTTTDQNGNFTIKASENQTLVASAVGFAALEIRVGNKTVVNFSLVTSNTELEGVVVTALGIKRAEKSIGLLRTADRRRRTE